MNPYTQEELDFFTDTYRIVRPIYIGEWGTNAGYSLAHWTGLAVDEDEHQPRIVTADLPIELAELDSSHPRATLRTVPQSPYPVTCYEGDGVTEILRDYVVFGKPEPALFYIDGDHEYHNVVRELNAIFTIAPNATILLHDTLSENVSSAVALFMSDKLDHYTLSVCSDGEGAAGLIPKGQQWITPLKKFTKQH